MGTQSKILVIGGTGYFGKFIVEASATAGHPTFALVRESTVSSRDKASLLDHFNTLGVTLVYGDMYDKRSLVEAIKQVDIVICALGHGQHNALADQVNIISAIKEAGNNIKRFFPSEFGMDVDRASVVGSASEVFEVKAKIRRIVEKQGIPYTYVSCNYFAGTSLSHFFQPGAPSPPRDHVVIIGDGTHKGIFNKEEDIATYTIKAVDDPRTINKIMYIRPQMNIYSLDDLVSLWEKKISTSLTRSYMDEQQLVLSIQEATDSLQKLILSVAYSVFLKGDQTNFDIEPSFGVEASMLYPDVKYTTVDEYLNQFV